MGHYIHSHAVHLFALAGPDLLFGIAGEPAKQNIVGMVEAAANAKKRANPILEEALAPQHPAFRQQSGVVGVGVKAGKDTHIASLVAAA